MNKRFALASTVATIAASAAMTASYANAENTEIASDQPTAAELMVAEQETVPVFIAEEVVQALPMEEAELIPENDDAAITPAPAPTASSLRELTAKMDITAPMSREMECLAGAIYFEARGEPLEGQLAVAKVVMNRAASSQFPSSYCGVVTQRAQFSFVRNGRIPKARRGSNAWKRAQAIAHIAHDDLWESKARDALYFHAKYVSPRWRHTKQARATIHSHIFYR